LAICTIFLGGVMQVPVFLDEMTRPAGISKRLLKVVRSAALLSLTQWDKTELIRLV